MCINVIRPLLVDQRDPALPNQQHSHVLFIMTNANDIYYVGYVRLLFKASCFYCVENMNTTGGSVKECTLG